ncbi:YlmC/YmxH family sporulation protein [Pontibacillus salicampi]|uniref:YlmC/YmxH family sporulation protein n=1 Tax=Pontibacillus salicampi TaxID=1449801 RepID=A0ABV6LNU3_9BACI
MVTISELQVKEVVSVENGQKLGHLTDLEIDVNKGTITAIILGNRGKMMGIFGKEDELVVPWSSILTIGEDVILVKNVTKPALYPPEEGE